MAVLPAPSTCAAVVLAEVHRRGCAGSGRQQGETARAVRSAAHAVAWSTRVEACSAAVATADRAPLPGGVGAGCYPGACFHSARRGGAARGAGSELRRLLTWRTEVLEHPGRDSTGNAVRRNRFRHDGVCADDRARADAI